MAPSQPSGNTCFASSHAVFLEHVKVLILKDAEGERPSDAADAPAEEAGDAAAAPADVADADAAAAAAEGPAPDAPADAPAETDAAAAVPAAEDAAVPAAEAEQPSDAAAAPAEEAAAAAPADEAAVPEEPKAPSPPPPPPKEPTSVPLELAVEDVSDTSVTITWRPPETIGNSGLDGYTVEICKEGTEDWKAANEDLTISCRYVIKNQTTGDRLKIRVVAMNPAGRSPPASHPEPVLVKEVGERPHIRLPRFLRQRYVANVGDKVNLTIPFSGKPKPLVTWTKDGQPLDTKKVNVRSTERDSILFIRTAEREDSGHYEMSVKVESFEDKATLILQIVELPGPPASVKVLDTWGFNVALEWTAPKDKGNTEITGYTIQKADKKTGDWFTVLEHYHRMNATISDLIMGNTYSFRVFSENKCGISEDATMAKETASILKTAIDYKPPEFKSHDFNEAPKFTTPPSDRATTVGYSTRLLASVRGYPKPKIEWIRNQMVIGEDPKYRQMFTEGICSLEIRKPGNWDGGVYTCRAKNPLGEAIATCKLEVKQPPVPESEK
ncbi:myosin binding protein Hb isoform X3 [Osmerus mordax]|uniref:myosin binding protein Hb isoform X3 n=1 Tax=Osmerus mordax TaxID=8014 RepID=UPI0035103982